MRRGKGTQTEISFAVSNTWGKYSPRALLLGFLVWSGNIKLISACIYSVATSNNMLIHDLCLFLNPLLCVRLGKFITSCSHALSRNHWSLMQFGGLVKPGVRIRSLGKAEMHYARLQPNFTRVYPSITIKPMKGKESMDPQQGSASLYSTQIRRCGVNDSVNHPSYSL